MWLFLSHGTPLLRRAVLRLHGLPVHLPARFRRREPRTPDVGGRGGHGDPHRQQFLRGDGGPHGAERRRALAADASPAGRCRVRRGLPRPARLRILPGLQAEHHVPGGHFVWNHDAPGNKVMLFFTLYFLMTGLHSIHVFIGVCLLTGHGLAGVASSVHAGILHARRGFRPLLALRRSGLGLPLPALLFDLTPLKL